MAQRRDTRSAYYCFVRDRLPELRRRGLPVTRVADAIPYCSEAWAMLTKEEKMSYAEKAREWNEKKRSQKMVKKTCNPSGPVPACPATKIASITSLPDASAISWKNDEAVVADIFYFLNIYSHGKLPSHCEQRFLPCEIGCVKYSLQDGIMADFHHFIDPELPPCGFRYHCQTASDATHKIPVFGFHLSRTCYAVVLRELLEFVQPAGGVRPHFYCRSNDRFRISWCLNRMASVTGIESCLELLAVEDLVIEMYRKKHQKEPSKSWVSEELDVFKWDFCSNTSYCISKSLASAYGVSLTAAHLPLQESDCGKNNIVKTVILDAGRFQKAVAEGSGFTFPSWNQEFVSSNCDSPRGVKTSPYEISTMRGRGITRWLESASDLSMSFSN